MCFADHLNLFSCTPTRLLNFKTIPSRLFQVLKKFLPPVYFNLPSIRHSRVHVLSQQFFWNLTGSYCIVGVPKRHGWGKTLNSSGFADYWTLMMLKACEGQFGSVSENTFFWNLLRRFSAKTANCFGDIWKYRAVKTLKSRH